MRSANLSDRLRALRDQNRWTVTDMAERTGIPKRTLDKYMLRNQPILPGFEALVSLSKGLGVSLDWLVFGEDRAAELMALVAQRASTDAATVVFEGLYRIALEHPEDVRDGERLFRMTPEQWADEIGYRTAELAASMASSGANLSSLLEWVGYRRGRSSEDFEDYIAFLKTKSSARSD